MNLTCILMSFCFSFIMTLLNKFNVIPLKQYEKSLFHLLERPELCSIAKVPKLSKSTPNIHNVILFYTKNHHHLFVHFQFLILFYIIQPVKIKIHETLHDMIFSTILIF